jgi:hypothetical protein
MPPLFDYSIICGPLTNLNGIKIVLNLVSFKLKYPELNLFINHSEWLQGSILRELVCLENDYFHSSVMSVEGAVHLFHYYHKRTESTLFLTPLSPWKCTSLAKTIMTGVRFNEIKQAVRGRTGDRTSFRAGSFGRHDHTTSVRVPLRSVAMFGRARLHAVESYHAFLHGAANSHFKNRSSFFIALKSVRRVLIPFPRNYALYAHHKVIKDGRPLRYDGN